VVLIAATYGLAYGVSGLNPGATFKAAIESDAFVAAVLTELLLQGVALSVVAVHVHRIILFGERTPGVYFAFPFWRTELLYVVMGALTYAALLFLGALAYGLVAVLVLGETGSAVLLTSALAKAADEIAPSSGAAFGFAFVVAIVVYVLAVWLMLRLAVWPPAVVANSRLALGEALRLTKGWAWALLGLMIASSLAYIIVGAIAGSAAYSANNINFFEMLQSLSLDGKVRRAIEGTLNPHILLLEFAFQFSGTTYTVAILSYAYKALKGYDANLPIGAQPADEAEEFPAGMKPMGAL